MHNQKVLAVLIGLLEDLGGEGGLNGDDDDAEDDDDDDAQDQALEIVDTHDVDDAAGASNPRIQKQLRRIAILCAKDAIKCVLDFSATNSFYLTCCRRYYNALYSAQSSRWSTAYRNESEISFVDIIWVAPKS